MHTTATSTPTLTLVGSPTDRMLTASLLVAPLLFLAADTVYAIRIVSFALILVAIIDKNRR